MRRFEGEVRPWLTAWNATYDLEWCSVSDAWLTAIPLQLGDNIRLRSEENGHDAAFTIIRTHTDDGTAQRIRMGLSGRDKLYPDTTTPSTFPMSFVPSVPNIESRTEGEAQARDELYEETMAHPSHRIAVTAPHGAIEPHTSTQAQACHGFLPNSSLWVCHCHETRAYPVSFNRWHITSGEISPRSFPGLARLNSYGYDAAVSFHGYSNNDVLVGGRAPEAQRQAVVDQLNQINDPTTVRVAVPPEPYDGNDPANYVNQITESGNDGIQIEMPLAFRESYPIESARRVAKALINYP